MDRQTVVSSRYNFSIPTSKGTLLYNAMSGAVLLLDGKDSSHLADQLEGPPGEISVDCLSSELEEHLRNGGYIVPRGTDEVSEIKKRYWNARRDTPMAITITTTQDCNLGCYYCYEERSPDKLTSNEIPSILQLTEEHLKRSGKKRLHVDWYGGEPLLNVEFLERASLALQELCAKLDILYQASIISNGTEWGDDVGSFVQRHKIRQAQISFDGLRKNHDRRRRYRAGYAPETEASSFDRAVSLVDRLLDHTRVDLRFNTDRSNQSDVLPFISFAEDRGWFDRPYPAVFQPARLASYSDHSSFLRKNELTLEEFDAIRAAIRAKAGVEIAVEESETPDGFPFPKNSVCAALAQDSVVIGADSLQYRCGLQVGETGRSVGTLARPGRRELPVLNQAVKSEAEWWDEFDPTTLPKCSRCSFLPICWGGCPKKHLEKDDYAIGEQSRFWRQNLPRLVAGGAGIEAPAGFVFEDRHQFRET
jgi:uncharacterized protein